MSLVVGLVYLHVFGIEGILKKRVLENLTQRTSPVVSSPFGAHVMTFSVPPNRLVAQPYATGMNGPVFVGSLVRSIVLSLHRSFERSIEHSIA